VYNALAASAVCISLGMSLGDIERALKDYVAFPMRFEVVRIGSMTLINDAYNANPASMRESLKELARMKGDRRAVAVLGDMLELGEYSETLHRDVGRMVAELGIDVFVPVGGMMGLAAEEIRKGAVSGQRHGNLTDVFPFLNVGDAGRNITGILREGDVILIKGSRVVSMEKLVENIRGEYAV
jgi:UDP-N-acetylmuramoyl-tripeptide--D-alanyl-D-alanine ligase